MTPQVTVQLYSVRDAASQDYEGTIRALAAMGFQNVEPAGYPGTTPEQAAKLLASSELVRPPATRACRLATRQMRSSKALC